MARKKSEPPSLREPSEREKRFMAEAKQRGLRRSKRAEVQWKGSVVTATHGDDLGNAYALQDTFGTTSHDFMAASLGAVEAMTRARGTERGVSADHLNSGLALLGAIAPQTELETALAMQMTGVHALACEMLWRAKASDCRNAMGDYGGLAVKLTRTFAAQVEALAKLRGGGKQLVEVKHVYVNGNAVVGDVHHAGGGGAHHESSEQPHTKALAHDPGAQCPPVWSEDAGWEPVPVASGAGTQALPDARGN